MKPLVSGLDVLHVQPNLISTLNNHYPSRTYISEMSYVELFLFVRTYHCYIGAIKVFSSPILLIRKTVLLCLLQPLNFVWKTPCATRLIKYTNTYDTIHYRGFH